MLMKHLYFLLVLFVLSSCASLTGELLKDPQVKVLDIGVKNITSDAITLDVKINVVNPNFIPINLGKISYSLNISDENVTQGVFEKPIDIPSNGQSDVTIPLTFKYNSLKNVVSSFISKSLNNKYVLSGSAQLGPFSIPFKEQGEIDLAKARK